MAVIAEDKKRTHAADTPSLYIYIYIYGDKASAMSRISQRLPEIDFNI